MLQTRDLSAADSIALLELYVAASRSGTLGRDPDEYELAAVTETIDRSVRLGFCIGAFDGERLCGEVHVARLQARRFAHVFTGLTIAVHPDHQGRGVGRKLFTDLLDRIDALGLPVTRVELMLQAGNPGALGLYASLGFAEEGRLRGRVRQPNGSLVDDIYMGRVRRVGAVAA